MKKLNNQALELERSLLRNMEAGEQLVYYQTNDTQPRNRVRFDAVRHEYEDGYGHPVQKIIGSFKRTEYTRNGVSLDRTYNNFQYIYIRGTKR